MKKQLRKTLILCLLLTLSHEKKRKKDDGDLKCYNEYCEDGDVKKECRSKGHIRRCTNRKNMGLLCENLTGQTVIPDLVCNSDFINKCVCGHVIEDYVDKATKEKVELKKAVCDCSMKSSAKVMIAMVVSFTIALAGCGYCFARWYVVKKETVRLELEKMANDSKFDTYGDYSNQSGGQRYSAATQSAGHRTGGGSGGQGCRTGRSAKPSPLASPAADKRGLPPTSESGKTSSTLDPAAAEERWRSVSPNSPAVQAWPVASNPAAAHLRPHSPNPGARARSRSPNPAAGRGRPVSPRPHQATGRGRPVSPNPGPGRGRPVSPNPAVGRGRGRPALNTTTAPKI